MKKRRRVELHIEHREVTVFARPGVLLPAPVMRPPENDASGPLHSLACPTCGAAQLLPLAETVASPAIDLLHLQQRMDDGSVHLHRAQDGGWWICAPSLLGARP